MTPPEMSEQAKTALYHTELGLAYLKQGDRARAKHFLWKAMEQAPNSAQVNAAMAYFSEQTGELSQAEAYYKKALSLAPHSGEQLNNYGAFLCRKGDYTRAETYFLRAVRDTRYINTAFAYENAGLCAEARSDQAKAVYFFNKALQHDPSRKKSQYELERLKYKLGKKSNMA